MAFDIYPTPATQPPQVPPISIAKNSSTTITPIVERRSGETPNKMYIRVATQSNPSPPTFQLQVTGGPASATLTTLGGGGTTAISSGGNPDIADAFITMEAFNVQLITILMNTATPTTWSLIITNPDLLNPHTFTFVVASSDAEASQAWLDAGTVAEFDALTGESVTAQLRVFNKGTGVLSGIAAAATGADAGSFTITVPAAATANPDNGVNVAVSVSSATAKTFAPTTVTFTSNDPSPPQTVAGHNSQAILTAKIDKLELAFVLDASGSMAFDPNGDSVFKVDKNATRWSRLLTGVNLALDTLGNHAANGGSFAVGIYPDITPYPPDPNTAFGGTFPVASPSANAVAPTSLITPANVATAKSAIAAHFPREHGGATPIGAGIATAIGANDSSFGLFTPPAGAVNSRRWALIMSDGNQNSSPPDPEDFYDGKPAGFQAKSINVATIGYGNTDAAIFPCNTVLLNQIAAQNGGGVSRYLFAQADATGALTQTFLKSLLFKGLTDLEFVADPRGVLTTDRPEVTRSIAVTPFDKKISFIVDWVTFDQNRLEVEIRTPTCDIITGPGAGYVVNFDARYRMFTFDSDFLRNAEDPTRPRYGTWTLIIRLASPVVITLEAVKGAQRAATVRPADETEGSQDSEDYGYQILVSSGLRLAVDHNQSTYAAGDTIEITASLLLEGLGVPNAAVTLSRVSPGTGALNWLASTPVTAGEFAQAAAAQAGEPDIDSLGIKKFALFGKGQRFRPFDNTAVIKMADGDGDGRYVASVTNTAVPGTYQFLVTAVGDLPDGTHFRRERNLTVEVVARPTVSATVFHIDYAQVIQPTGGTQVRATPTVRPLDPFGNVVLIDPAFDPSILFTNTGGTFAGPIVDNHDGSYARTLLYPPGQSPSIGVTVNGDPVVDQTPVVAIGHLTWIDKVFAFHAGTEATPGANQHKDPAACLGDLTLKPNPGFVSLGGHGSITVGVSGYFIVATGFSDDFTVFVHLDSPPRPYIVYAIAGDRDNAWTEVGRSSGVTQSFGLRRCGFRSARALLIVDASNRLGNADGTPSSSPGVSILGVGIKRVDRGDHDCDNKTNTCVGRIGGKHHRR
jgi:hypothetical protein